MNHDPMGTKVRLTHLFALWLAVLLPGVVFVTPAQGSNMAFRKVAFLPPGTTWISIPTLYNPQDFGTPGLLDSEDLCQDLGAASSILRWDGAGSQFVSYACGSPSGWFALQKGAAYGIVNGSALTLRSTLVGAHDDAFMFNAPPDAASNLSWISLPYHLKLLDNGGTPPGIDAEDLCRSIGPQKLFAVMRWDPVWSAHMSYVCGSTLDTPFLLDVGEGVGLVNVQGQTISWQPPHY